MNKNKNERASGVAQGEGPEFKPQYCKKKGKKERTKQAPWLMLLILATQELDRGSKLYQANRLRDPILKILNTKKGWWNGSVRHWVKKTLDTKP
jgi:hypothetical protein